MRLFVRLVSILAAIAVLGAGTAWPAEALAPPQAPGSEPQPGADLQFVRVGPLTLAEMHQGMEVQALLVAGQEPAVGLEIHTFESLPPAADAEAERAPSAESTPE